MRNALTKLALGAVLIAGLAPMTADASDHCRDIFLISGVTGVNNPTAPTEKLGGVNIGSATCTSKRNTPVDEPNVNYLTPGATHVWVALSTTNALAAPAGTIKIGTAAPITLTWVNNATRMRWDSQAVALGAATTALATVSGITSPTTGLGTTQTVTYTTVH